MRLWRGRISSWLVALSTLSALVAAPSAQAVDPSWPKEVTFAILSTESAPEITRRWAPVLAQLEKDLVGIKVKHTTATDYRGTIEALKFKKAELGWLGPKAYIEASNNNYANVEPIAQVRAQNGSLGYRSCLIVHADSDVFTPEDMAGKTFAFNDPNSTSGYLVPQMFFMTEMGSTTGSTSRRSRSRARTRPRSSPSPTGRWTSPRPTCPTCSSSRARARWRAARCG